MIVSVIGSCRLHLPIRYLYECNHLLLNNYRMNNYVHSIDEIIQIIKHAQNITDYNSILSLTSLTDLYTEDVIQRNDRSEIMRKAAIDYLYTPLTNTGFNYRTINLYNSDYVIIEISSIRNITMMGYNVNYDKLLDFCKNTNQLKWLTDFLSLNNDDNQLDSNNEILSLLHWKIMKYQEFKNSLIKLRSMIPSKLLIVGPIIDYKSLDKFSLNNKCKIINWLEELSKDLNFTFCNFNDLINDNGIEKSLKDKNHWNDQFIPEVGKFLMNFFIK